MVALFFDLYFKILTAKKRRSKVKKKIILIFLTGSILPFLTGCGPVFLKKLIKDNPDIVTDSIEANPEKFMEALSKAQEKYRQTLMEKRAKEMAEQREKEFDSPKKPVLGENRVYFGKKEAPITIVKYSDFQCGFCSRAADTMKQVLREYPDDVRVLYKHLPLANHPQAGPAARYYEAIGIQDPKKAYEFHDLLFKKQQDIGQGEKYFKQLAKKLKVDMSQLEKDLKKAADVVSADEAEAQKFGINGTPGFLVGGVGISGAQPFASFKELIDKHIERGKKKMDKDIERGEKKK